MSVDIKIIKKTWSSPEAAGPSSSIAGKSRKKYGPVKGEYQIPDVWM